MSETNNRRPTEKPKAKKASDPVLSKIEKEIDAEGEPMTLAEEMVGRDGPAWRAESNDHYEQIKKEDIHIAELQRMSMPELIEVAKERKIKEYTNVKKQDLIFNILKRSRQAQWPDVW